MRPGTCCYRRDRDSRWCWWKQLYLADCGYLRQQLCDSLRDCLRVRQRHCQTGNDVEGGRDWTCGQGGLYSSYIFTKDFQKAERAICTSNCDLLVCYWCRHCYNLHGSDLYALNTSRVRISYPYTFLRWFIFRFCGDGRRWPRPLCSGSPWWLWLESFKYGCVVLFHCCGGSWRRRLSRWQLELQIRRVNFIHLQCVRLSQHRHLP